MQKTPNIANTEMNNSIKLTIHGTQQITYISVALKNNAEKIKKH